MKLCTICGVEKSLAEFYIAKTGPRAGKVSSYCRACNAEKSRAWKQGPGRARHAALNRASRFRNRETYSARGKRWFAKNPEARYAQNQVRSALRRGDMVREPCSICGATPAHAHHDDYSKPLIVRWLCPKHHKVRHAELASELACRIGEREIQQALREAGSIHLDVMELPEPLWSPLPAEILARRRQHPKRGER